MYSEEDMIKFMQFIISQETLDNTSAVSEKTAKYYLEQFKKK
jgi:nicotinamide mononucleotide (NMN) deamidase PncC